MRIHLGQLHGLFQSISRVPYLFSPLFITATSLAAMIGFTLSLRILQVADMTGTLQGYSWHPAQVAGILLFFFATTAVHELGHGVVCTHLGVPVRGAGVMIFYLQPAAYVDVTDCWRLPNRWHRVLISAAGIYVQAIVNALLCLVWLVLRSTTHHGSPTILILILLNLSVMIFNIFPFVRLDGYWMLSNILGIPNLLSRAQEWSRASLVSKLTRTPINPSQLIYSSVLAMQPLGRTLLVAYGITSTMWATAMWLSGIVFLFRMTRWAHLSGVLSYVSVLGTVLGLATWFAVRRTRTGRTSVEAAPPGQPAPLVNNGALFPLPANIQRDRKVSLSPHVSTIETDQGQTVIAFSAPDQFIVPTSATLRLLLGHMRDGTSSMGDLEEVCAADLAGKLVLGQLWAARFLRYTEDWEALKERERYTRQLGWFSMNQKARGQELQALKRLGDSSVILLGAGGLGTHVAWSLAAAGVGRLHLVDGDTIELSNLNRQLFYLPQDVGRSKVEVLAERLNAFRPDMHITAEHKYLGSRLDVSRVIGSGAFVVRAMDSPDQILSWINEACVLRGVPSLGGGFMAQGAMIGPTVIPGETPCMACDGSGQSLPTIHRGIGGTLAPVVAIAGGLIAGEVICYLAKLGVLQTAGRVMVLSAPDFSMSYRALLRNMTCPVCAVKGQVAV